MRLPILAHTGPRQWTAFVVVAAGRSPFRVADLLRDGAMLEEARREAFALVQADPKLLAPEHRALRASLLTRWRGKLDLAGIG